MHRPVNHVLNLEAEVIACMAKRRKAVKDLMTY